MPHFGTKSNIGMHLWVNLVILTFLLRLYSVYLNYLGAFCRPTGDYEGDYVRCLSVVSINPVYNNP